MLFGKFVPDCVRSNLNFPKGVMPSDPPSSYTHLRMLLSSCPLHPPSSYAHLRMLLSSCPPPPQLKILYETLVTRCHMPDIWKNSTYIPKNPESMQSSMYLGVGSAVMLSCGITSNWTLLLNEGDCIFSWP